MHPQKRLTTILVVDDHPVYLDGIITMLDEVPDFELVGQASDGELAIELVHQLNPDVVLMDVNMPVKNGIRAAREITERGALTKVVIMSAYDSQEQAAHALRSGAMAFYAKTFSCEDLLNTLRIVARGTYVVNGQAVNSHEMSRFVGAKLEPSKQTVSSSLSPREHVILVHITHGLSNKEIASLLGISPQTVKNHMTSILRKLALNDRTQAAIFAIEHGWIRINPALVAGNIAHNLRG